MTTKIKVIENEFKGPVTSDELANFEELLGGSILKGNRELYNNRLYTQIKQSIEVRNGQPGAIIRVLQNAQNLIGYLPTSVIKLISHEMKMPLAEVYGIISFYHFFSLHPKGKYVIQVCMGTSCYVKGGQSILNTLKKEINLTPGEITPDGRFSLETVRCLGACGISPVISTGSNIHGRVKPSKLIEILDAYK
jgi:NADH:ubiquinone oxidoreductase subunit E